MKFLFLLLSFFSLTCLGSELRIPDLTAPVVDEAQLLDENEEEQLNQLAYEIYTHNGPQISILTVKNLQDTTIEDFSIRVAEKWQLGQKSKGNGLLILIAKEEREVRIEVGNGIEGEITDYASHIFIQDILTPSFKAGDFKGGLEQVMIEIAQKFGVKLKNGNKVLRRQNRGLPIKIPFGLPFYFFAYFIIHALLRRHRFLKSIFNGVSFSGLAFLFGLTGIMLIVPFFVGIIFAFMGTNNILHTIETGSMRSQRYPGGFRSSGGFGGGWSGGGGGFSGGGSSGKW